MKKRSTLDSTILVAETAEEAGLLYWMSRRFEGKVVNFEFDTSNFNGTMAETPAMWIREVETANQAVTKDEK